MSPALFFVNAKVYGLVNHSRKIQAVAVATGNTKPHLPPMYCPVEKTGAIANSQRIVRSKEKILMCIESVIKSTKDLCH
jgi:hypothetical protein